MSAATQATLKQGPRLYANARRYYFTTGHVETEAEREHITRLAEAFLGTTEKSPRLWGLAVDAARAHFMLQAVRDHRLQMLQSGETDQTLFALPPRRSDRQVIIHTLKRAAAGATDLNSEALRDLNYRERREPPRSALRRHTEVYTKLAPDLEKLERYEDDALRRRKKALRALAAASYDSARGQGIKVA